MPGHSSKKPSKKSKHDGSHKKSKKAKYEESSKDAEPERSSSYRDRAKERREGINKDFKIDPDDVRISNPTVEDENMDEKERRLQEIEESKYLGGDVEHTHLVKGLDFALLEKVKKDQELAEKLEGERKTGRSDILLGHTNSDSEEEEFMTEAILAASKQSNSKRQIVDIDKLKKGNSTEIIPCRTAIARRLLNVLDEAWPEKSELFLPGRMSYIVPIGEDCEDDTVTTVLRSKANASTQDDGGPLNESEFALDQLTNIIGNALRAVSRNTTNR